MSGRYPTRFGFEFTPTPPSMLPIVARLGREAAERNGSPPPITYFDDPERRALAYEDMGVPPSEVTLAETLGAAGYHTVHIGKWHLGRSGGMAPHEQGFDESLLMASGLYLPEDHPEVVNAKQDFDPIDRFLWKGLRFAASFNGGEAFEPGGYLTDWWSDEAVRVIEANANRPFFLYLAYWAPHTPLQATRADYDALAHIEDHTLRVYAAMIRALDRGVGRVLGALREQGLEDDTLVIFTSDNGGAHYVGLPELNRPYRGWKITHFEGGIHVPYFMRWPARIPPGSRFAAPVHHFDVYASAAAAAGAPLPTDRELDGVDLLPFVRGEAEGKPHDRLFWRQGHYRVVLADGWKLQRTARPERVWLFNLESDPTEQRDVAAEHPAKVAELQALLAAHDAEQQEPAWPALIEAPIPIDRTLREAPVAGEEYVYWPN
jgi:arylsulfatase A-like enzyme